MKILNFFNNPFIVIWMSVMFFISMTTISCDQEDENNNSQSHSSFTAEGTAYQADETISYKTSLGNILQLTGVDFKMCIVLSDNESNTYDVVDTLRGADTAKARAILKMDGKYRFTTSGTINYSTDSQSGSFNLFFDDLELQEGTINTDTLRAKPLLDFTKLHKRDTEGMTIKEDTTDWNMRTNWHLAERLVFNLNTNGTPAGESEWMVYPNPVPHHERIVRIQTETDPESTIDFFIVNENLELEAGVMGLSKQEFLLRMEDQFSQGNYYRFYYRINADIETYYGSGDIKVSKE